MNKRILVLLILLSLLDAAAAVAAMYHLDNARLPDFNPLSAAQRFAGGAMVLDGVLSLTARARNVAEISLAWIVLRDPVEAAVAECGWGP